MVFIKPGLLKICILTIKKQILKMFMKNLDTRYFQNCYPYICNKLNGVGAVDNRPSTDQLQHFF